MAFVCLARLATRHQLNGVWNPIDYTYTEYSTPTGSAIKARSESRP